MRLSLIPNTFSIDDRGRLIAKGKFINREITLQADKINLSGKTIKVTGTVLEDRKL